MTRSCDAEPFVSVANRANEVVINAVQVPANVRWRHSIRFFARPTDSTGRSTPTLEVYMRTATPFIFDVTEMHHLTSA